MTTLEKNRLIGTAFLVLGFFHLATLVLTLIGFSFAYPFVLKTVDISSSKLAEKDLEDATRVAPTSFSMPGFGAVNPSTTPTPVPAESKAQIEAKRTMTMIYVLVGVQIATLLFVLFAGFTVVNIRAGGRTLGIVASIFLIFFYPLGAIVAILGIWFLTGDECMEIYSEVEKDRRAPQSII